MPSATVITLGCKVNQYESRGLTRMLLEAGYALVPFGRPADVTVINSCTVTAKADREVRALVRRAGRVSPGGRCVVTGCLAETCPEALVALPGVALVLGQARKTDFLSLLEETERGGPRVVVTPLSAARPVPDWGFPAFERTRAFFRIQDGCSAGCTYCIVPRARGPSRSLPTDRVLEGVRAYARAGKAEVVLSGIHLGAWGLDLTPPGRLPDLLQRLVEESIGLRFRLSSIEPLEVSETLVQVMRASPGFCPHLHLPLQSGDDATLERMRRPYRADFFEKRVLGLARDWPDLCLGADVMVGFPGEDEAAFARSRDLIQRLPLAYLHVFPYSKRPRTLAAGLHDQVPGPEVQKRAAILREIGLGKRRAFLESHLGQVRPTLVENTRDPESGLARGLTDNYIRVLIADPDPPMGRIVPVRLTGPGPKNHGFGRLAKSESNPLTWRSISSIS
jgi:threonylcarbamoyladenosine tRNA methylthiotransferase MtaB